MITLEGRFRWWRDNKNKSRGGRAARGCGVGNRDFGKTGPPQLRPVFPAIKAERKGKLEEGGWESEEEREKGKE